MEKKDLTIKEYIDKVYYNLKDCGNFDDLNNAELTTFLLLKTKNLLNECLYAHQKNKKELQNDNIKKLFNIIGILAKINDINLVE